MKIILTSASGTLLSHNSFDTITLMTEMWEITILPNHEPLLAVVRPGVLLLKYTKDEEQISEEYITGGGVITITPEVVTIVLDAIDNVTNLMSEADIEKKKKEAQQIIDSYQWHHSEDRSVQEMMEAEYQYLRYAAMQELIKKSSLQSSNSRR